MGGRAFQGRDGGAAGGGGGGGGGGGVVCMKYTPFVVKRCALSQRVVHVTIILSCELPLKPRSEIKARHTKHTQVPLPV